MNRLFIRRNITSISIIIFLCLFSIIQYIEPTFLYKNDGSLREFGIGRQKKTIMPIWLLVFILAIFCYLFVLYYLTMPKFNY
jgi:hypothetical protein